MTKLRTLIVDDEPLAREGLSDYVAQVDFLQLEAAVINPLKALPYVEQDQVDLILLDIEMPYLNGLDFIETLQQPPLIILTTAYPNYALEGFRLDVLDYLVKPITFQRFLQAVLRAKRRYEEQSAPSPTLPPAQEPAPNDHFFIKVDGKIERIEWRNFQYAEAMQNYIQIYTDRGRFVTLLSLREMASQAPNEDIMRVHKSYLANLRRVQTIDGRQLRIGESLIPVSRSKWNEVQERILGNRLLE